MSEYHHYWTTRFGTIGVNRFGRESIYSRGPCREYILEIPISRRWNLYLSTPGKDYLTLVEGPSYLRNLSWIIDEFDSSFNDLAIASLRYHLDFSVCDNESRRELYEDIIRRLGESSPDFTDDEMAILQPPGWTLTDELEPLPGGGSRLKESTPAQKAIYQAYWQREEEYHKRIAQARHDFVDIMRHLWS